jgi:Raf kinase inhibitor-like YbhB/YbcL family protein
MIRLFAGAGLLLLLAACGGGAISEALPTPAPDSWGWRAHLAIITSAFADGGAIPDRYSCEGEDISPVLEWNAAPPGIETFTLMMADLDAPGGIWVHWVVFNIPGDSIGLPQNQPRGDELPGGGMHGKNSWGNIEYGGPCPPGGSAHSYRFMLYGVDSSLDLSAGASRQQVEEALSGHVLAQSMLTGTYQR